MMRYLRFIYYADEAESHCASHFRHYASFAEDTPLFSLIDADDAATVYDAAILFRHLDAAF